MKYTRDFGSQFPNNLIDFKVFRDVDASVLTLVTQIKTLQLQGKYDEAKVIIDENKTELEPYMMTADYLNYLSEELRNVEIYAQGNMQNIFYTDTAPTNVSSSQDVWIGA